MTQCLVLMGIADIPSVQAASKLGGGRLRRRAVFGAVVAVFRCGREEGGLETVLDV